MRRRLLSLVLLPLACTPDDVSVVESADGGSGSSGADGGGSTSGNPASTDSGTDDSADSTGADDNSSDGSTSSTGAAYDTLQVVVRTPYLDPVPGVGVVLELAEAEPIEAQTDADGQVVFEGFFAEDIAGVLAHKDGWRFASVSAGFIASHFDGGPVELFISPFDVPDTHTTISGTAANMTDEGHSLGVVSSNMRRAFLLQNLIDGSPHFDPGPGWTLPVRAGEAFTLVAVEFDDSIAQPEPGQAQEVFGWFVLEHDAVDAPTTVDIDFADATAPTVVTGSFLKPAHPGLAEYGAPAAYVDHFDGGRGSLVGATRLIEESADGTAYDYEIEYIEVPGFNTVTEVQVYVEFGIGVLKIIDGPPPGGTVDLGFHTPPLELRSGGLFDPMSWTLAEGETYDRILVDFDRKGLHQLAPAETATVLPPLPSSSDVDALFDGGQTVSISTCSDVRDGAACFDTSYSQFHAEP